MHGANLDGPNGIGTSALRNQWQEVIARNGPYDVMITLGFRCDLSLDRARFTLRHFLRCVHRRLYGKYWRDRGLLLQGLVVVEHKWNGSPHFHMPIRLPDDGRLDEERLAELEEAVSRTAERLRYPTPQYLSFGSALISGTDYVDVTPVHNVAGLSVYLVKQMLALDRGVNVGVLAGDEIDGL
jgi:hypothetical protein